MGTEPVYVQMVTNIRVTGRTEINMEKESTLQQMVINT